MDRLISGLKPGETYNLRLHFAEMHFRAVGQRRFNLLLNGNPVLQDFDILAEAGGARIAVVKQVTTPAAADGSIRLQLQRGSAGIPALGSVEVY